MGYKVISEGVETEAGEETSPELERRHDSGLLFFKTIAPKNVAGAAIIKMFEIQERSLIPLRKRDLSFGKDSLLQRVISH